MLATVISVLLTTQLAAPLPVDSPLSPVVPASDPPSHSPYIKHHAIGWHVPKTAIPASGSGASAPYPSNSAAAGSDVSPVASMCSGAGDKRKKPKQKESAPDTPNNSTSKLMRNAFYPAWIEDYTAEDILWDEYDMVVYFVAPTTSDGFTIPEGQTPLQNFVAAARARGKKALVSIGGWTGSVYFSELTTEGKREGFVNQLVQFANDNAIDGLDFDWEYPNDEGAGCNIVSPQDTANFLATLKLVRQRMGNDFILTADTAVTPFNDESGEPSQDVSEFADVLDYITPMAYSISGGWSEQSGPESPLYSCGQTSGSAASALEAWTAAGFPASKILMGISGLGQAFTTQSSTLTPQIFDGQETLLFQEKSDETPQGDPSLDPTQSSDVNITDICGNSVEPAYSGAWTYQSLVDAGLISADGSQGGSGFKRYWDECTSTPFLFNPEQKQLISYSDAESNAAKVKWLQANGVAGWSLWETSDFSQSVYDQINQSRALRKD